MDHEDNDKDITKRRKLLNETQNADLDLPDELLLKILSFCTIPDFYNISTVDKRFHKLCSDSGLWKIIFSKTFGGSEWYQLRNDLLPDPTDINWFKAFKEEHHKYRTVLASQASDYQKGSRILVQFFPPEESSYVDNNKLAGIIRNVIHSADKEIPTTSIPFIRWWEHLTDLPVPEQQDIIKTLPVTVNETIFHVELFHIEKTEVHDPLSPQTQYKYSFKPFKSLNLPEHVLLWLPQKSPQSPNGSFMLFLKERLLQIRKEEEVTMREASSALIFAWKDMGKEERKTYDGAAMQELKRYKLQLELHKVYSAMKSLE